MIHKAVLKIGIPVIKQLPAEEDAYYILALLEHSQQPTDLEVKLLRNFLEYLCDYLAQGTSPEIFVKKFGRPGEAFAGYNNHRLGQSYTTTLCKIGNNAWKLQQVRWAERGKGPAPLIELLDERAGRMSERWERWKSNYPDIFAV